MPDGVPRDPTRLKAVAADLLAELDRAQVRPDAPTVVAGDVAGGLAQHRIGHYDIIAPIGRGGMGTVYRARDSRLGRVVALKVFEADDAPPAEVAQRAERFRREANALARLGKHRHLVQVHDMGEDGARVWFAMDLVEGTTLRAWLRAATRTPREVASMVHRVALGLAHAHAMGVIHRDVKPDNVFVDREGEPQVGDFGLVRDLAASRGLTEDGQVMGTLAYMAPEQARGDVAAIGPATDVHALGVMLYEGLTGSVPFEAEGKTDILARIIAREAVPPRRLNPRIADDLEAVVMKCLEKERSRRYADAKALAEDLGRWLEGEPVTATRITPLYWIAKKARRHRARIALVAAAAGIAMGGIVFAMRRDAEARRSEADRRRAELQSEARTHVETAVLAWMHAESELVRGQGLPWADPRVVRELETIHAACVEALNRDPDSDRAHAYRARALEHLGRPEEAIRDYDWLIARAPADGALRIGRLRCRLQATNPADPAGWLREVVSDAESGLLAEPDNPRVVDLAYARIEELRLGHPELAAECDRARTRIEALDARRRPR